MAGEGSDLDGSPPLIPGTCEEKHTNKEETNKEGGRVSQRLFPSLSPGSQSLDRDTINTEFANMASKNSSSWQGPPGTGCTFAAAGPLPSERRLGLSASVSLCPPPFRREGGHSPGSNPREEMRLVPI